MSDFQAPKYNLSFKLMTKLIMHLTSNFKVTGLENLIDPPFIMISNHLQYADIFAIAEAIPHDMIGMGAKKIQHKMIGRIFNVGPVIWIEQESPDLQALKQAIRTVKQGYALVLSPEGHRSKKPGMLPARDGAAYIANRVNIPIVPVGLTGTHLILQHPRPNVTVTVGKPFTLPEGRASVEELQIYTEYMMCTIATLLPETYHGHYANHPLIDQIRRGAYLNGKP